MNFICMCGGTILHVRTLENGRKVFKCNRGTDWIHQELFECVICHMPRIIWADDGTICGCCGIKFLSGELMLTDEQKKSIEKWKIIVRI